MSLRRLTIALLAALILAACGTTTPPAQPSTATSQAITLAPTQASASTALQVPAPTTVPQATAIAQPSPSLGSELLFLRKGALIAFDIGTRNERRLAEGVRDFAPAPDGRVIALVRGEGRRAEIWTVRRDAGGLVQLTKNDRAEATLAWAPDGLALMYGSSTTNEPYSAEWMLWSAWCVNSEVRLLMLSDATETSFGPGCDPAFSPDGKRIAYATPPSVAQEGQALPGSQNTIRLINRQGQNGWSFATASGSAEGYTGKSGLLVYTPAWSPDGKQIVYHRFIGYRVLEDLDLTEIGGSLEGKGKPLNGGAGWLLSARFAPNGQAVAIVENDFSDPRGFGGYDNWKVSVLSLDGTREIALPEATLQAIGRQAADLPRAQSIAWAPDGTALVVLLPPGWSAQLSPNEPIGAGENPGAIWRWRPGSQPEEKLVEGVDFASPLTWLPPGP
jgi:hypothetical protein